MRLLAGDSYRISLEGVVRVLNEGPDQFQLPDFTRDAKIRFEIAFISRYELDYSKW